MAAKPKAAPAAAKSEPAAEAAELKTIVVEPSLEVEKGLTADHALAPNAAQQEGETLEQAVARIRELRIPFGSVTQKLALPMRPGYHRHWFNDVAGRIDEAKASGWSHVKNPRDGTPLKRVVGTGRDDNALYAYAMELPEVFWLEEMAARHKVAQDKIDSIKKNPFQAAQGQSRPEDKGKFYDPTEGSGTGPLQVIQPKA